jgi:putative RecB family exonuclease
MPSFSHSKIGTFENCKLQFRYRYIDRIKVDVEDTIETYLGSRVHETLEKLYRDLRFEKDISLDGLLDYFNKKWKENWKDSIKIVSQEYSAENYRKMGERYIRDYFNHYRPFDQGKVLGLETQDFLTLDDHGRYSYHIRIDRLMDMGRGLYEVHDYKTNNTLPAQEDLDNDRQLAMYALWVKKHFKDFKKVRLVWHFVAFDKEMESFRTEKQLEDLRQEVLSQICLMEAARDFPPHVSSLCRWCLYQAICPMWKHEKELEEKPVDEWQDDDGLKLVDEYVKVKQDWENQKKAAEEKLEKLKEAIVRFCREKGFQVVTGTDNKITVREQDTIKFPGKNTQERFELVKFLRDAGKFESVIDLDVFALKKIFENRDWDEDILTALGKYTVKETSFSLSVSKK